MGRSTRYPVLRRPLPPGLVTLGEWARSIDRAKNYIEGEMVHRDGFPEPVGELATAAMYGRSTGELVYEKTALEEFRRSQPDLWGHPGRRLILGHSPGDRVSLAGFTALFAFAGLDYADLAGQPGLPPPDGDGMHALGVLVGWHNELGGPRPRLTVTPLGRNELVTVTGFARIAEVGRTTVSQYRSELPAVVYGHHHRRLGEMADWWNSRSGKPGPVPGHLRGQGAR